MVFITALDLVVSSPLPFESLWLSAMDGLCWRRVRTTVIWVYATVCWLHGQNYKYRFYYGIFSVTLSLLPSPGHPGPLLLALFLPTEVPLLPSCQMCLLTLLFLSPPLLRPTFSHLIVPFLVL